MNIYIGWLFKLIPLIMGLICIALGGFVLESSGQSEYFVAGHVLISLAAICLALFTTAFIIISQLTRGVNTFYNTLFPIIGYAGSIITMIWGWALLAGNDVMADEFVAGHVIFGVGMIAACVSTVAASSGHFLLIPKNAAGSKSDGTPVQAYSSLIGNCLIAVPVLLTLLGFIWSITLLRSADITPHYVAGHVLLGLTAICACLIGLVATIVHQTRNTFSTKEHWLWCYWVIFLGSITVLQGIYVLVSSDASARLVPRHYSYLPRNDLLQHILKSLATGTGMETYLFVSQQNTDDSRLHLPVLPFPDIVSCGNGADRHGIFYSFAGFGRFRSGMLYVVLNRFNIRSRFC